jgi:phenylacetate-CoA ligase
VLATEGLAPHFQIHLSREGRMDAMAIHVEVTPDAATDEARAIAAKSLSKKIKDNIGVSAQVIANAPGGVPRSEGKAVRVVDNRG